jgi:hypothetical protein
MNVESNFKSLSDQERLNLLDFEFNAPHGFQWPFTERMDKGKSRRKYLGPQHFTAQFAVFTYSVAKSGIFCKPCALFAPESVRGVNLDRLGKSTLQTYTNLTDKEGYLTKHVAKSYHEDSVARADAFRKKMISGVDIAQKLKSVAAMERDKNRTALKRIITAVEHHGRLGLPLRGHRDSGELPLPDSDDESSVETETESTVGVASKPGNDIDYTQGYFRATLQLMVGSNDTVLEQHLRTSGKNATYISSVSQNALIEAISASH